MYRNQDRKREKKKKKRDGTKQTGLTIQYINTNSMNSLVRHLEVNQSTFPRQIDACNEPPVGMGKRKKREIIFGEREVVQNMSVG